MVKFRALHTKTLDSFDFNDMPDDFTRLCWLLLPLITDGEGRGILDYSWIRSKMYPLRTDVKLLKLQNSFEWMIERGMIAKYSVNGKNYYYVIKWKEYQKGTEKEAQSSLPSPDLVESNSGVGQELVKSNSASYSYTDSKTETESKADAGRAENTPHPVILAIKKITGYYPPKPSWDMIVEKLKNGSEVFDPVDFEKVYKTWLAAGHNPKNYNGMVDWYIKGVESRI